MSPEALILVLVRHGLTDWNEAGRLMGRTPMGLNARGRAQAERMVRALRDFDVRAVLSSPQARARETAEPIARARSLPIEIEEGIDEVWLGPQWQGKTLEELRGDPDLERTIADPGFECEAIEPIAHVQARMVAVVERLRVEREGTMVLVTHGDPLRAILAYYLVMPLPKFRRLVVDNGSMSVLRFTVQGPKLVLLNGRPSLASE